jgi:hypothetical protein
MNMRTFASLLVVAKQKTFFLVFEKKTEFPVEKS